MAIVQVPGFETDCIPLSQAIFQFCIEDNPALEELYQKPLNQLTKSDIAELREAPLAVQGLPADLWPILEVLDWQNGLARDPQGVFYYSIHAASARRRSATVAIAAQESAATKALASELKNHPNLKRAEAFAWCREAGFELNGRGFQQRVWPKARLQAGLAERAQPGRKRNSSH